MRRNRALPASAMLLAALAAGCANEPVPRPRGYFRIDLPPDSAAAAQAPCPFSAEIPRYAHWVMGGASGAADSGAACRADLLFPGQRAALHLTWRRIQGDLPELVRDAYEFKEKHEVVATRIRNEEVERDSSRVFGTLFLVEGNVASPVVFFLTDSTANFLYGALYFDVRPNADSLAPVTDRIRSDIRRLAHTLRWEGPPGAVQHVEHRR
ncbi:MAG: hypothetical protein JST98_12630 [Bacteroidetes bacterium]|nr:hypothetical protein [Bacteroidota bacterium]MBS1946007.1 hypothetical protein [Bacteroidota bacterium]